MTHSGKPCVKVVVKLVKPLKKVGVGSLGEGREAAPDPDADWQEKRRCICIYMHHGQKGDEG